MFSVYFRYLEKCCLKRLFFNILNAYSLATGRKELLKVSHLSVKFSGPGHCDGKYRTISVYQMISQKHVIKGHVTLQLGAP